MKKKNLFASKYLYLDFFKYNFIASCNKKLFILEPLLKEEFQNKRGQAPYV